MLVQQIAVTRSWGVQFLLKKEAHELHQCFSILCLLLQLRSGRQGGVCICEKRVPFGLGTGGIFIRLANMTKDLCSSGVAVESQAGYLP